MHRKRDGERLVVASQQIIYHDLAGQPVRILEANADITERQRAEAELNQSQEQLRALADRLVRAREEEATRIARELHDQFGRYLTTIKMDVRSIERDLAGELTSEVARVLREKAQTIGQTVDETVQTVRAIATQLRPGLLDDLGLAAAIEWQAKDFQKRSGILCSLTLPGDDPPLSRDQATAHLPHFPGNLNQRSASRTGHEGLGSSGRGTRGNCAGSRGQRRGNFAHAVGGAPLPGVARNA